ncbi:MAG TPA: ceramidase domain-containing protein [Gammaproteobacteria bacterium]|nr:ceramidase domain-containing protein [Gammaproteobacteria bacterium]
MTDVMDVYCERVGPGLLAEPLNAVSNASFLLAAWAAWVLAKRTGTLSAGVRALIAMAASVAIGSILWHTYPTALTLILDIIPILIFIIWYIWLYTRNVIGMRSLFAVASAAAFLLATFVAIQYSDVLHGALVYSPGLLVVVVFGVFHARERMVARFTLLAAAGVYLAALFFRTIDNEVCPVLPIGTHYFWHLLVGLVTYLVMRALILSTRTQVGAEVR